MSVSPIIELPVVKLRPMSPNDAAALEAGYGPTEDPWNWAGFRAPGWWLRRLESETLIGPDSGTLVVADETGRTIGDVTYRRRRTGPLAESFCWGIGVLILAPYRGRGYGASAQRQLAIHLLQTTHAERVEADTDVDNRAEQRALQKAGFTREGVLRRAQFRGGLWHDVVIYSLLRGDV